MCDNMATVNASLEVQSYSKLNPHVPEHGKRRRCLVSDLNCITFWFTIHSKFGFIHKVNFSHRESHQVNESSMTREKATLSLQNTFPAGKCSCICNIRILYYICSTFVLHTYVVHIHIYMYYIVSSSGNFFMSAVLLSARAHQTNWRCFQFWSEPGN